MSQNFSQPGQFVDSNERRQHPRHQVNALAYLDIGPDNGGIILNISEGGLALHAVGVLPPEPVMELRIQFSKSTKRLETTGKVAWTSGSKKDAGIEFIDLPEEDYLQIKDWLASQSSCEPFPAERKPKPELAPPPNKRRTDKWIKLAAELPDSPVSIAPEAVGVGSEPPEQKLDDTFTVDETPPSEPAEPHPANHPDLNATTALLSAPLLANISENAVHPETPPPSARAEIPSSAPLQSSVVVSGVNTHEVAKNSQTARDSAAINRPGDDFLTRARVVLNAKRRAGEEASQQLLADWVAAAQDFWSRNSSGTLTVLAVAAAIFLGLGIVVGRSIFKPTPKITAAVGSFQPNLPQPPPVAPVEQSTSNDTADSNRRLAHRQSLAPKDTSHRNGGEKNATRTSDAGVVENEQETPNKIEGENAKPTPAESSADSNAVSVTAPVEGPVSTPPVVAAQAPTSESGYGVPATNDATPRTLAPPDRLLPSYLIYRVAPSYPKEAIDQKIEGTVKIHLIVGRNGRVKDLKVVSGPHVLHQAALDAAQHWRYIPALRNGEPVETEEDISVLFQLPQ
jgi:TonB family protein